MMTTMKLDAFDLSPLVTVSHLELRDGTQYHRIRACFTAGVVYVEINMNGQDVVNVYAASDVVEAEDVAPNDVTNLRW
jgi:hypothetical protein